jgi:hypothetical protein
MHLMDDNSEEDSNEDGAATYQNFDFSRPEFDGTTWMTRDLIPSSKNFPILFTGFNITSKKEDMVPLVL